MNPDEADVIRLIFDKFANDRLGINGTAEWLNDNGYRKIMRQNGKYTLFSISFIKNVLDNPVHTGKIAYGRRSHEKVPGKRNEYRVLKQDTYDAYDGQHEAIISDELWEAARARRQESGEKHERTHSLGHEHVLSGILHCPVCGAQMYGSVNRKKKKDGTYYKDCFYYVCRNRKAQRGSVMHIQTATPAGSNQRGSNGCNR
ncbi:MAG: recombinase family protein [Akkermansiaceae bacterium]|nr:recombinase family protein [Akkermansiaceae bacterium]